MSSSSAPLLYWQRALFGVFVLMVFEGALRKWAFPSAQAYIYFVKDAVLLTAYVGFVLASRRSRVPLRGQAAIRIVLLVAFLFGCIEVFNPNSPSVLVGLMGLKAYFLYAPIAFILPYAFESRDQLLRLVRCYLVMAIPVALLGFAQIAAGPDSFLNTYVSHSEEAAVTVRFGEDYDLVRTSGTFSYISGYAAFLTFIAFLALGYNMAQGWRIKNNIAPLVALTLVIGAMFTTGSRGPVFTVIAACPVILWLAVTTQTLAPRTAMRLFILVPIIALVALNLSPQAFEAFAQRASGASDSTIERVLSPVSQVTEALAHAPTLGIGIGTTHPGALAIMGTDWPWWLEGLLTETEMARVTVELGLLGLLLIFGLRVLVVAFALRAAMSFKDSTYRALGIVLAVYLGLGLINSIMLDPTAGLYYWGALGLMLAMRRLEQAARAEAGVVPGSIRTRLRRSAAVPAGSQSIMRRIG
jgi:hypothetical protein